jgi:c-di-GMP-binding flagellar brake protein YcgR
MSPRCDILLHSPLEMPSAARFQSGQRRRLVRVPADLRVVVALRDGQKAPARVLDVSTGGMHLEADRVPAYGEALTVVVRLREGDDWHLIPATVRWFSRQGFGVAFEGLDERQTHSLSTFVKDVEVA